ncbi:hypothetical protein GYO_2357 [Bacillus spizizenii TU-B-10]|uniref:Uncharacterized protein n=1 Tax=Bacillus spizizenii (strain DSM 15029 / JCM 12233 / NBRC 101239 / NRRL B-23049 / TU-B-10) TaxID=1052585 RepID=G4NSB6_BACS4|nr:hypothetical protein GYO_2357 [Bacillus spizizenii TU-B-10]
MENYKIMKHSKKRASAEALSFILSFLFDKSGNHQNENSQQEEV